jgi:copper chaperone CopZ
MLPTRSYTVEGMTCGHCSASVTQELLQVDGVKGVDVDLDTGRVTVAGESFADDAVAKAIDEAGYTLVS